MSTPTDTPETWTLVLSVPTGGPTPAAVRMRHLLKRALRDFGIRCVAARDHQPADPAVGVFDVRPADQAAADRPATTGTDRPAAASAGAAAAGTVGP